MWKVQCGEEVEAFFRGIAEHDLMLSPSKRRAKIWLKSASSSIDENVEWLDLVEPLVRSSSPPGSV